MLLDQIESIVREHVEKYHGEVNQIDFHKDLILYKNLNGNCSILGLSKTYSEIESIDS